MPQSFKRSIWARAELLRMTRTNYLREIVYADLQKGSRWAF